MKQFIYLDTNIVNSIIAQNENGLTKDTKTESSSTIDKKAHSSIDSKIKGNMEGGIAKLAKLQGQIDLGAEIGRENGNSSTKRELIEKTMHDASFNIAYEYIKANKIIIGNETFDDCGEYIELSRVFDFVDLNYLEGLFSSNGMLDYLKKTTENEIKKGTQQIIDGLNREQRRTSMAQISDKIKRMVDEKNKEYDDISEAINVFKKMIPYSRMLISNDGYLIPLDEQFFRVNPSSVGFMYGGEITCVGMISNIIGKDTNPNDESNIFATLQYLINECLRTILPTKQNNICVVHPIAVYYNK